MTANFQVNIFNPQAKTSPKISRRKYFLGVTRTALTNAWYDK